VQEDKRPSQTGEGRDRYGDRGKHAKGSFYSLLEYLFLVSVPLKLIQSRKQE
jgi:hypothetical protein